VAQSVDRLEPSISPFRVSFSSFRNFTPNSCVAVSVQSTCVDPIPSQGNSRECYVCKDCSLVENPKAMACRASVHVYIARNFLEPGSTTTLLHGYRGVCDNKRTFLPSSKTTQAIGNKYESVVWCSASCLFGLARWKSGERKSRRAECLVNLGRIQPFES